MVLPLSVIFVREYERGGYLVDQLCQSGGLGLWIDARSSHVLAT